MRLATLRNDSRDGRLIVVSPDGERYAEAPVETLQAALEDWEGLAPGLSAVSVFPHQLDPTALAAPLPRAWQWLDASAFLSHSALMEKAMGMDPVVSDKPLMYQGVSDTFYGPLDDVAMAAESLYIDFEGEFGIVPTLCRWARRSRMPGSTFASSFRSTTGPCARSPVSR